MDVTLFNVEQILISFAVITGTDPLDAAIGTQTIQAEQQPLLNYFIFKVFSFGGASKCWVKPVLRAVSLRISSKPVIGQRRPTSI